MSTQTRQNTCALIKETTSLKLVDKFTNLRSSVSSIENDINIWLADHGQLSVIRKSDLTNKIKRSFFQAEVVSILPYGCTTWTLTKRMEKKLDDNYTRMLRAILNKSFRQHLIKKRLYGHLPPITKTIQVRWTRHLWHWQIHSAVTVSKPQGTPMWCND